MTNLRQSNFRPIPAGGRDFGGVAFGFDGVPDFLDFAVGVDQKTAADDSLEQAAHEFLAAPGAVGFDHFVRGIAEQREIEFVLVAEVLQCLHGVGTGSKDGGTQLVEFLFLRHETRTLRPFNRSICLGEEEEKTRRLEVFDESCLPPSEARVNSGALSPILSMNWFSCTCER